MDRSYANGPAAAGLDKWLKWLAIGVSSVLIIVCLVTWTHVAGTYGVDVIRGDQWGAPANQILAMLDGRLTIDKLAAQHNETRKPIPNLLSIAILAWSGHFNTQAELFVGFGLGTIILAIVAWLAWLTFRRAAEVAILTGAFCSLLWSSRTFYFHMYSITFERLIPELCLVLMLAIVLWRGVTWSTVLFVAVCAFVAQYSYAGGAALWGLAVIFILIAYPGDWRANLTKIVAFVLASAISSYFYFVDYSRPPHHSELWSMFDQSIGDMLKFFFMILGNAVDARGFAALILGLMVFVPFAVLFVLFLLRPPSDDHRARHAVWFVIGGYSISQALLAMIGRLPMSIGHALRRDYVTHSMYIFVASIALLLLAAPERFRFAIGSAVLMLSVALTSTLAMPEFWKEAKAHERNYEHAKACVRLVKLYADENCLDRLYHRFEHRLEKFTSKNRLMRPQMVETATVGTPANGEVASLSVENGLLRAEGWAQIGKSPADAVIAAIPADGNPRILAIARVGSQGDASADRGGSGRPDSSWRIETSVEGTDVDRCTLRFFAFDNAGDTLRPIDRNLTASPDQPGCR